MDEAPKTPNIPWSAISRIADYTAYPYFLSEEIGIHNPRNTQFLHSGVVALELYTIFPKSWQ